MARTIGSWMSGSGAHEGDGVSGSPDQGPNDYPGQRLGLPETGPGSIARFGRRTVALLIDWFIAYGLAGLAVTVGFISRDDFLYTQIGSTTVAVVWLVLGVIAVRLFGFTPGQFALGIRVASVDERQHVGLGRATVRGLLVFLVIPALFTDADYRGLQDQATKTAVVRR
jgi:uncharacterized RDD family membrane protein YckC